MNIHVGISLLHKAKNENYNTNLYPSLHNRNSIESFFFVLFLMYIVSNLNLYTVSLKQTFGLVFFFVFFL